MRARVTLLALLVGVLVCTLPASAADETIRVKFVDSDGNVLRGLDLPTQEGRLFSIDFDDPSVNWTGEVRVPFQVRPGAAPEVLDVRVTLAKKTVLGPKRFRINGTRKLSRAWRMVRRTCRRGGRFLTIRFSRI